MKKISLLFSILFFTLPAIASDFAKEQRWADQIVDFLIDGEAEWLIINNHKTLAIYTEAQTPKVAGTVIIIHGSGVRPNWPEVIQPVRTSLPEFGWNTLSIQMPILSNDATYSDYADTFNEIAPRINSAVKFIKDKGANKIIIIAHSLGSTMSAYYLASETEHSINAFIAIGMPGKNKDSRMNNLISIEKINIPMLDIYGSVDLDSVIDSASARKKSAFKNTLYFQKTVKDANHFFTEKNSALITEINNWLNKQKL